MESIEEAERKEEEGEEEEEESPKELEPEEEEIAMAGRGVGFSVLLALEEDEFAVKKSRSKVRLNSEKDGRRIGSFTFYEEPVAETLRLPWWLQCV